MNQHTIYLNNELIKFSIALYNTIFLVFIQFDLVCCEKHYFFVLCILITQ